MALNLIGLIQASRKGAVAFGQGFRNYVAGSPVSGTRMTDYVVNSLTISGATPAEFTEIPPFTNVTLTAAYTAGSKLPSIFDDTFTERVTGTNGTVSWDVVPPGSALPYVGPWVELRSFTHTPTGGGGTIVATLTLNNWAEYTGTLPPAGSSYRAFIPAAVTFKPEQFFNPRRTSPTVQYTVLPQVQGQPSPILIYAAAFQSINNAGSDWVDLGGGQYLKGDEVYSLDAVSTGNYRLIGYRLKTAFSVSSWISSFNSNYFAFGLQITYQYEQKQPDNSWLLWTSNTYSQVQNPTQLQPILYGTPGQTFTLRCKTQVVAPFTSPLGTSSDFVVTIADKLVGPGGGPLV